MQSNVAQNPRNAPGKQRPAPPWRAGPTAADYLAEMAAEVMMIVDDFDDALCQAARDADALDDAGLVFEQSLDARMAKLTELCGRIEHNLLVCFRGVSSLRTMATFYAGRAESECAA